MNHTYSKIILLALFFIGKVVTMQAQTTAELKVKAADGDVVSMLQLGVLYAKKETGELEEQEKNKISAAEWNSDVSTDAVNWITKAASLGNAEAAYLLGYWYNEGLWVDENHEKAVQYFLLASNKGHAEASYYLGRYHEDKEGYGIKKDINTAISFYEKSALSDYNLATYRLGEMYLEGAEGVPVDTAKSMYWFEKGANANDSRAMYQYAELCNAIGQYIEGADWMYAAAALGNRDACYDVGMTYYYRQDEDWDEALGLDYLKKAADKGMIKAQQALDYILKDFDNDFYNLAQQQELKQLHQYYLMLLGAIDNFEITGQWQEHIWDSTLSHKYNYAFKNNIYELRQSLFRADTIWQRMSADEKNKYATKKVYLTEAFQKIKKSAGYYTLLNRKFAAEAFDLICKKQEYKSCVSCKTIAANSQSQLFSLENDFPFTINPWEIGFTGKNNQPYNAYTDFVLKSKEDFYASSVEWAIGYKEYDEVTNAAFGDLESFNLQLEKLIGVNNVFFLADNKMLFLTVQLNVEELFLNAESIEITDVKLFTRKNGQYYDWTKIAPVVLFDNKWPYSGNITAGYFISPQLLDSLKEAEWVGIAFKEKEDGVVVDNNAENLTKSLLQLEQFWSSVSKRQEKLKDEQALPIYNAVVQKWNKYLAENPFPKRNVAAQPVIYKTLVVDDFNKKAQDWQQKMYAYAMLLYTYMYSIPDFGEMSLAGTSYYHKWVNFKNAQIDLMVNEYNKVEAERESFTKAIEQVNRQIISDRNAELTRKYEAEKAKKINADRLAQKQKEEQTSNYSYEYTRNNTRNSNRKRKTSTYKRDYASEFYDQQRQYGMQMLRQGKVGGGNSTYEYKGLVLQSVENKGPDYAALEAAAESQRAYKEARQEERRQLAEAFRKMDERNRYISEMYYKSRPAPCYKCGGTSR